MSISKALSKAAVTTARFPGLLLLGGLILASGCTANRTKLNDKSMRVMVDPDNVTPNQYTRIVDALVRSGKWTVVDRGPGLEAVVREQSLTLDERPSQFEDKQKWAQWGRLWGVGAVAVGRADCYLKPSMWNFILRSKFYVRCEQFLTLVDATSAEVLASGRAETEGDGFDKEVLRTAFKMKAGEETTDDQFAAMRVSKEGKMAAPMMDFHFPEPEWDNAISSLYSTYPADFPGATDPKLKQYGEESGAKARKRLDEQDFGDEVKK